MRARTVTPLLALALLVGIGLIIGAMFSPAPALSQDGQTENMQILREKIKADKKLLVAANMELTESEAKGFWPVYENYQKDLSRINQRIAKFIKDYAADYRANTLTEEKAKKLIEEFVSIDHADAALKASYIPLLRKVMPQKKVLRYLQIENKIRAVVRYDLAVNVPLVN